MKALILVLLAAIFYQVFGQKDIDTQLKENRNQLTKIKNQISALQDEISKSSIKSENLLKQIKFIDKKMGLITNVKQLLNKKNRLLSKKLNNTKRNLEEKSERLKQLKNQYVERCKNLYKYGRIKSLDLLINSKNLNQAYIRYKYLNYFTEQETKIINNIKNELKDIEELKKVQTSTLSKQKRNLKNKEIEEGKYITSRDKKRILLRKLKWNKKNLTKQLSDAEQDYKKLNSFIVTLEKKRKEREKKKTINPVYAQKLKDFAKAKGKLYWPVKGKVITKYGKQRNQTLKTYVKNTGIDIKAKSGAEAKAAFQGLVSMVTYLGGYGNTVILDHGQGYYTVYSHLSDILIDEDQYLRAGDTIGLVGESGSLEGAKLHFEIYAKEKTVDPLKWLR